MKQTEDIHSKDKQKIPSDKHTTRQLLVVPLKLHQLSTPSARQPTLPLDQQQQQQHYLSATSSQLMISPIKKYETKANQIIKLSSELPAQPQIDPFPASSPFPPSKIKTQSATSSLYFQYHSPQNHNSNNNSEPSMKAKNNVASNSKRAHSRSQVMHTQSQRLSAMQSNSHVSGLVNFSSANTLTQQNEQESPDIKVPLQKNKSAINFPSVPLSSTNLSYQEWQQKQQQPQTWNIQLSSKQSNPLQQGKSVSSFQQQQQPQQIKTQELFFISAKTSHLSQHARQHIHPYAPTQSQRQANETQQSKKLSLKLFDSSHQNKMLQDDFFSKRPSAGVSQKLSKHFEQPIASQKISESNHHAASLGSQEIQLFHPYLTMQTAASLSPFKERKQSKRDFFFHSEKQRSSQIQIKPQSNDKQLSSPSEATRFSLKPIKNRTESVSCFNLMDEHPESAVQLNHPELTKAAKSAYHNGFAVSEETLESWMQQQSSQKDNNIRKKQVQNSAEEDMTQNQNYYYNSTNGNNNTEQSRKTITSISGDADTQYRHKSQFMLHRKSVNHDFYSQLNKLQQQKEQDEYISEEVSKVRSTWWQYEQSQGHLFSPLKWQLREQALQEKAKYNEAKKEEIFSGLMSSAKHVRTFDTEGNDTQGLINVNSSIAQLNPTVKLDAFSGQNSSIKAIFSGQKLSSEQSPPQPLLQHATSIVSSLMPFNQARDQSNNQASSQGQTLSMSSISIPAGSTIPNYQANLQPQSSEKYWQESQVWESIVRDSHQDILHEKILDGNDLTYEMLLDFLNLIVGRQFQNNQEYLHASLKLVGLTPDISEFICDKVSRIMYEKYSIPMEYIQKFQRLYRAYEKRHLNWDLVDRIGGRAKIEEILLVFCSFMRRDHLLSGVMRSLNITNDQVREAAWELLREESLKHKQYFGLVEEFFKQPLSRLSHTKFFLTFQVCLKTALDKHKVPVTFRTRLFLLIEQMRYLVTAHNPTDLGLFSFGTTTTTPQQSVGASKNDQPNEERLSGSQKDINQPGNLIKGEVQSNSQRIQAICLEFGCSLREKMLPILKYKQGINKLTGSLSTKEGIESALGQLAQVFIFNTHSSLSFLDITAAEKYIPLLTLGTDFFNFFRRRLLEFIKPICSVYCFKDTVKRLNYTSILLQRMVPPSASMTTTALAGTQQFRLPNDRTAAYINNSIFFNELVNHPSTLEFVLDKLVEVYLGSTLNKVTPISRPARARTHCRYILTYFYSFNDQYSQAEFVSAYDFQCYIKQRKLKMVFFQDFKKILKDVFSHGLEFPQDLVSCLLEEYNNGISLMQFYDSADLKRASFQENPLPNGQPNQQEF